MEQLRLILAVFLSTVILFLWQYFYEKNVSHQEIPGHAEDLDRNIKKDNVLKENTILERTAVLEHGFLQNNRVKIQNDYLNGSINLNGARIDDLSLQKYANQINSKDKVVLLAPQNTVMSYFTEFGWLSNDQELQIPNQNTKWKILKKQSDQEVTLYWKNDVGIRFLIDIKLDDHYMFSITQHVENHGQKALILYPYASVARSFGAEESNAMVHEGAISSLNDKLTEYTFKDILGQSVENKQQKGWLGFSDKYWLISLIPESDEFFNSKIFSANGKYQMDILKNKLQIEPGQSIASTIHIFAGAKKIDLLHKYQETYGLSLFDRAVDFGILYFITKPIFLLLNYFYGMVGNFGIAILILTLFIKLLLFPLAYKGFSSMNRLKILQPRLAEIKERHSNDAVAFQKAIIELYKKEKVNPMSGCLPLLLQMPIFFALYKVLSVTIEMRHALFFGWIKDLSAQDPTSIFNLFGLLPWSTPGFLMIGTLPIAMALTMHIQQKLNPAPTDPVQAKVMNYLPLVLLFVFSSFPSGLVLYWTCSNILSIVQQVVIKKLSS